jgi:hypothetical protein
MSFKLSALGLFAISALFIDGAIAQPSAAPTCAESVRRESNYTVISVRVSERESALVAVKPDTTGNVPECRVMRSGGSETADKRACIWVQDHWHSLKRCPQP